MGTITRPDEAMSGRSTSVRTAGSTAVSPNGGSKATEIAEVTNMVDLNRNNCGVCGGLFTIGDWASIVGDAWVHLRCKWALEVSPTLVAELEAMAAECVVCSTPSDGGLCSLCVEANADLV